MALTLHKNTATNCMGFIVYKNTNGKLDPYCHYCLFIVMVLVI